MTLVKIKSRCEVCGFEVEWTCEINKHGFFQIPDGFCPNDLSLLIQNIDNRDYKKILKKGK